MAARVPRKPEYIPRPSNNPPLGSKYHQRRTIGFYLRVVRGTKSNVLLAVQGLELLKPLVLFFRVLKHAVSRG